MSAVHDGGPAFHSVTCRDGDNYAQSRFVYHRGMSLRDWFAGQALMGWAAGRNNEEAFIPGKDDGDWEAEACYRYADAMLRAREGGGK